MKIVHENYMQKDRKTEFFNMQILKYPGISQKILQVRSSQVVNGMISIINVY